MASWVSFKGKLGVGTHFCAYFWPRRPVRRDRSFWGGYEINSTDYLLWSSFLFLRFENVVFIVKTRHHNGCDVLVCLKSFLYFWVAKPAKRIGDHLEQKALTLTIMDWPRLDHSWTSQNALAGFTGKITRGATFQFFWMVERGVIGTDKRNFWQCLEVNFGALRWKSFLGSVLGSGDDMPTSRSTIFTFWGF